MHSPEYTTTTATVFLRTVEDFASMNLPHRSGMAKLVCYVTAGASFVLLASKIAHKVCKTVIYRRQQQLQTQQHNRDDDNNGVVVVTSATAPSVVVSQDTAYFAQQLVPFCEWSADVPWAVLIALLGTASVSLVLMRDNEAFVSLKELKWLLRYFGKRVKSYSSSEYARLPWAQLHKIRPLVYTMDTYNALNKETAAGNEDIFAERLAESLGEVVENAFRKRI